MFWVLARSTEISLKQRLEYIARAILSAKSSSSISAQASDGEFLHELEEKMDVRYSDDEGNRTGAERRDRSPFFSGFPAGAHPSPDPGDPDQAVLPSSLGEKRHLPVGLGAHGHHQGNQSGTESSAVSQRGRGLMTTNAFSLSFTGSLRIISSCPSVNWPSSTAADTRTPSWCSRCGRKSWRKASASSRGRLGSTACT